MRNPLTDPLFWPSLSIVGGLFVFGAVLVLVLARRDLRMGLTGELGHRLIGWLIIAPVFLIAAFTGGVVAASVLLFAFYRLAVEYARVVGIERPYTLYLYALIPITLLTAVWLPTLYFMLPAGAILLLTLVPILTGRIENLYNQMSFAGRGYLYVVWSIGHLVLLQQLAGVGMLMLVAVGVALSDAMQFVVGRWIGRHVISPSVHPRKAWEGLIGDWIGAGAAVALFSFALPSQFALPEKILLAFLIGCGAAWGDLVSSLVKRAANCKDWGDLIPGHGGLLDRANSLVVAVPLVYYFVYLILEVRK